MSLASLPYDVARAWSAEWELVSLLKDSETAAGKLGRYLHPDVELRQIAGRGRGIVATKSLEAGNLVLMDIPVATADTYEELLEIIGKKSTEDVEFRRQLLSMCGDGDETAQADVEKAPSSTLIRNVVRHNYHGIDWPPLDGDLTTASPGVVGLWPLGSIVNHSLRPNVARNFVGQASCYRLIRPIREGEEVLDNYFDLRLPHKQRQEMCRANHGIDDEGPDAVDAPAQLVSEVRTAHEKLAPLLEKRGPACAQKACKKLAELTNRCDECGVTDPAFTDIFRDFAIVVGKLGDAGMSLDALAKALEFATAREPYSVISCTLTLRMLHMACLAADTVSAEARTDLEALARDHCRMVYGPEPELFELFNPEVMQQLQEVKQASTPVGVAEKDEPETKPPIPEEVEEKDEPDPKRPRIE